MKVYFTDPEKFDYKAKDIFKICKHTVLASKHQYQADILFIRAYRKADEKFLANYPKLKFLLTGSVGIDHIDQAYCKDNGIAIVNAPGSNANSVAEHVISVVLMLLKKVDIQRHNLINGKWRSFSDFTDEISDKTIGLVGCGAIGKKVAEKFYGLGVKNVIGYDPFLNTRTLADSKIKKCSFDKVLKSADVVSLHLPLTSDTQNLISYKNIQMMKKTAYLVNTSRGGIVNEMDLLLALEEEFIAGAALDVFVDEPLINPLLLSTRNLICTPHIGGFSKQARTAMAVEPVRQFLRLFNMGRPIPINQESITT